MLTYTDVYWQMRHLKGSQVSQATSVFILLRVRISGYFCIHTTTCTHTTTCLYLYYCTHTTTCPSAPPTSVRMLLRVCTRTTVRILLRVCTHTTVRILLRVHQLLILLYVSSYLILLYASPCPGSSHCVSAYLILLCMCPHTSYY
jgi:hypothetical protein